MAKLRVQSFGISLDGFGAGPHQDMSHPIGVGGMARVRAQAFLERQDVRIVAGWSRSQDSLANYMKLTGAHGTQDWRDNVRYVGHTQAESRKALRG